MSISQWCSPLIVYWFEFLPDITGLHTLRTCSRMYALQKRYVIKKRVTFNVLPLYDRFSVKCVEVNYHVGLSALASFSTIVDLEFEYRFNSLLPTLALPPRLESLKFGGYFDQPLLPGTFPESLKCLKFGLYFNQVLVQHVFPQGLIELTFGFHFNQPIGQNVLPSSLDYLCFGRCFNQELLADALPPELRSLILSADYSSTIVLPASVAKVSMGHCLMESPFGNLYRVIELNKINS